MKRSLTDTFSGSNEKIIFGTSTLSCEPLVKYHKWLVSYKYMEEVVSIVKDCLNRLKRKDKVLTSYDESDKNV
uniref:hypothetical protein n=1 Tax=Segatella copri TaxID=165179 RepID=UPI003FEF7EFD